MKKLIEIINKVLENIGWAKIEKCDRKTFHVYSKRNNNKWVSGVIYHIAYGVEDIDKQEKYVRNNCGIVIYKTLEALSSMKVMFVMYFNKKERQLIEYVK